MTYKAEEAPGMDFPDLDDIFDKIHEHDSALINRGKEDEEVKATKEKPPAAEKVQKATEASAESSEEPLQKEEKSKDSPKKDGVDYKSEYEKLQKTSRDTQKAFHENRKQLSAYKKAVEKLKADGGILDEEAAMLLDHTKFEDNAEDENILVKYGKVWDKEIEYMRKYSSMPQEIDQNVRAFQHFMQTASREEVEDALSELSSYEDDEVEITKQMLNIGKQYYDDIYGDIEESGSIRNLRDKFYKKEKELQESIDKLQRKYNKLKEKYEDHDESTSDYKMPSGSSNASLPKNKELDLTAFFDSLPF